MAEIELNADDLTGNFTGMTKDQIYQLMSQMKSLIDQNEQQARHILIQNPKLTQVLFQAQIMLGMVRPNLPNPNNPAASTHPQQAALPPQQTNVQAALPLPGQSDLKDQTKVSQTTNSLRKTNQPVMPVPSPSTPFNSQSQPLQSHPLQSVQGHLNAQASTMPVPQSSQFPKMHPPSLHSASSQPSSLPQPPMPSASTQSQQSLHTSGMSHMQLQPSMPSQARPASVPAFGHQLNTQMGPNAAFQHSNTAVQMHHSQPMFHSGQNHPPGVGHSMSQGHQPPRQLLYQGGNPHLGMEFNHVGGPVQAERGPSWIPGLRDNATGTQHIPGPPPPSFMGSQMGPAIPPLRPPSLSSDMESALLQQVMSLTPEQINLLPPEQRNQVLQLQQMLRQSQ